MLLSTGLILTFCVRATPIAAETINEIEALSSTTESWQTESTTSLKENNSSTAESTETEASVQSADSDNSSAQKTKQTETPAARAAGAVKSFTIVVNSETYVVNFSEGDGLTDPYTAEISAPDQAKSFIDADLMDPAKKNQANNYLKDTLTALIQGCDLVGGQFKFAAVDQIIINNITVADFSDYETSPLTTTLGSSTYFDKLKRLTFTDMLAGDGLLKNNPAKSKLATLILPKIKRIGTSFASTTAGVSSALISIYAPEVQEIGDFAFDGQMQLAYTLNNANDNLATAKKVMAFPAITKLGAYAFRNLKKVEYISFDNLVEMGEGAFENCEKIVGQLETGIFLDPSNNRGPLIFPKLKAIPKRAFYNCASLNQLSAPQATTIGDQAFYNCLELHRLLVKKVTTVGHQVIGMDAGTSATDALTSIALPVIKKIETDSFSNNKQFKGILTSLRNLYSTDTDSVRANLPEAMLLYAFPDYERYSDRYLNEGESYEYQFYRDEDLGNQDRKTLYKYIVLKQPKNNPNFYRMHTVNTPTWWLEWNISKNIAAGLDPQKVTITPSATTSVTALMYPGFYQGVATLHWNYGDSNVTFGDSMVMFTGEEKPVNQVMLDIHDIDAKQGDTGVDFVADVAASQENVSLKNAQLTIQYPADHLQLGTLKIEQNGLDITGAAQVDLSTIGTVVVSGINAENIKEAPIKIHFEDSKAKRVLEQQPFEGTLISDSLYDTDTYYVEITQVTKGLLSLLWVPEFFDFGSHSMMGLTTNIFPTTTKLPQYVVVSDKRDDAKTNGWKVQLTASELIDKQTNSKLETIEYQLHNNQLKEWRTDDLSVPPIQQSMVEPSANIAENALVPLETNSNQSGTTVLSAKHGGIQGNYALEINDMQLMVQNVKAITGNNYNGVLTWTLEDAL